MPFGAPDAAAAGGGTAPAMLLGVALVVAGMAAAVQQLARRRVALDSALAAQHAMYVEGTAKQPRHHKSGPVTPQRAAAPSTAKERHTAGSAEPGDASIRHIRVYWPVLTADDALTASDPTLYGWCFLGDPSELVAVVAGVRAKGSLMPPALDGVPQPVCIGTLMHGPESDKEQTANEAPLCLETMGPARRGAYVPRWHRVRTSGVRLADDCAVTTILYRRPNAARLQSYMLGAAPAPGGGGRDWTRLETLLAMDPERWHELSRRRAEWRADERLPGSGLRMAVPLMNAARWSLAKRPPHATRAATACRRTCAWAQAARVPAAAVRRSALALYAAERLGLVQACGAYAAQRERVNAWLARAGSMPNLRTAQRAAARCWDGLVALGGDLALGQLLAAAILQHDAALAQRAADVIDVIGPRGVHEVLERLAHWPMGLKLNTELALFLGDVLGSVTDAYSAHVLAPVSAQMLGAVRLCAQVAQVGGASLALSAASDALGALTLHIWMMQELLRHVQRFFMYAVAALFDVFRGKKHNPLHGRRLDDAQYEFDQLFLGTILFTLLVFLFPTVLMYYGMCTLALLAVLGMRAALSSSAALLHHLPLYTLALRAVNPLAAPAGVALAPVGHRGVDAAPTATTLQLESVRPGAADAFAGTAARLAPVRALPALVWASVLGRPLVLPSAGAA